MIPLQEWSIKMQPSYYNSKYYNEKGREWTNENEDKENHTFINKF